MNVGIGIHCILFFSSSLTVHVISYWVCLMTAVSKRHVHWPLTLLQRPTFLWPTSSNKNHLMWSALLNFWRAWGKLTRGAASDSPLWNWWLMPAEYWQDWPIIRECWKAPSNQVQCMCAKDVYRVLVYTSVIVSHWALIVSLGYLLYV